MEELYLKINVTNERFTVAYFNYIKKALIELSHGYGCGSDVQVVDDGVIEVFIVYPEKIEKEKFREAVLKALRTKTTNIY